MPLDQYVPLIDDRRYDDIITEVRTRIARYAPEWRPGDSAWTDVNDNDPGVTMVQVLAWLTELLTYRMSKVPELNYIKFLQLLGIELNPAEPALAEVTLPVQATYGAPFVIVPSRTQLSADPGDGGPPLIFETQRALIALTAKLAAVLAYDGYSNTDVTEANDDATRGFLPFGPLAVDGSALLLGFSYAGLFPQTELDLAVFVTQDTLQSNAFQCGLPPSPVYGPARIRWEYWNGTNWERLDVLKDETVAFTRSGHVHLRLPPTGAMQTLGIETPDLLYWVRARIELAQYERPPSLAAVRTNTAPVEQAETVNDEVLGGSNGRRDQVFRLASAPVLGGTLKLEIDQGDGYKPWTQVADLFGSSPTDFHYVLDRTSGEVRLGDGVNGAIAVANVNNAGANVVAREYRFGGGKRANVLADTIKTLVTPIDGIDENAVTNLFAAHSGREEETLPEAKKRAPRSIRSRCRAVTNEDFEYLAKQAANVKRAKALPLFHPKFPGVPVPGVVSVIVVPDSDDPKPTPSEGTLRTVCAYLEQRRLLTTELYVLKPTYRHVEIDVQVLANDNADLAEASKAIVAALCDYFHPLRGGEDGQGWLFGGTIFYSRVYQRVFRVDGVQSIAALTIVLDGKEAVACTDVTINPNELVYSIEHRVDIQYRFED
jgi:predicted phage baseplate assembly protein